MMNIKIVFEADSIPRLREQMLLFLGAPQGATIPVERVAELREMANPGEDESPSWSPEDIEEEIKVKREKKVEAKAEAKDLAKMKEETLNKLKDLFVAGKGKMVRELLVKHGHGAKVFPEVEAKYFPAIKEAIDKELGL
jgi:hypothetical protein